MNASLLAQSGSALVQGLASLVVGAAAFALTWTVARMLASSDAEHDDRWRYDVTRINELRRISLLYRLFQPVVVLMARFNLRAFPELLPEIARQVQVSGKPRVWTGAEYLARMQLIAVLMLPVYLYFCVQMMGPPGAVLAFVGSGLTVFYLRRRLSLQADYRLFKIKQRLPFMLDLLTLLMEAGSTFLQALEDAVKEFEDHPAGQEFGRVLGEMNMGKTRIEAFESLRDRLQDQEITSIVGSIIQGEQLGTPLARLFRTQADVLRIKRTQRAETIANEAGVKMLGPAVLVMAATVLVILGPFLLGFIYTDFIQ